MKIVKVKDLLRGSGKEITLRYDPEDTVKLPCFCKYDPALVGKNGNEVLILRKVEVQDDNGIWKPYPSVTWLDCVENDEQLITRALVKDSFTGEIYVMSSPQGLPDGELISAAEEAGVYVEFIDGDE